MAILCRCIPGASLLPGGLPPMLYALLTIMAGNKTTLTSHAREMLHRRYKKHSHKQLAKKLFSQALEHQLDFSSPQQTQVYTLGLYPVSQHVN